MGVYAARALALLVPLLVLLAGCTVTLQKEAIAFVPNGAKGPDAEIDVHDRFVVLVTAARDLESLADREGSMLGMDMEVVCLDGTTEFYAGSVRRLLDAGGRETNEPECWRYIGAKRCFDRLSTSRMLQNDYSHVVFRVRIRYMFGGRYSFTPFCVTRAELVRVISQGYKSRPGSR